MRTSVAIVLLASGVACVAGPGGTATAQPGLHLPRAEPWPTQTAPAQITLADGRKVAMFYRSGKGLLERHSDKHGRNWTKPRLIYRTKTEPCQDIRLKARGNTVTAIANFARYCSDGEPPMESIAAVGVGSLHRWDHHLLRGFDGWTRVTISKNGKKATFIFVSDWRPGSLTWTAKRGFARPVFITED